MVGVVETVGTCFLCNKAFGKEAMTAHLRSCLGEVGGGSPKTMSGAGDEARSLHIVVEGRYGPEYWLHLAVPADAMLADLDAFLRDIWLECCGHLSMFVIGKTEYHRAPDPDAWDGPPMRDMNVPIGRVLRPPRKFRYEYDFGSTTHLDLHVVAARRGRAADREFRVLAENDLPIRLCMCGQPAVKVCACCRERPSGWLCAACAVVHPCVTEQGMGLLPVVNSPRTGVCGYAG